MILNKRTFMNYKGEQGYFSRKMVIKALKASIKDQKKMLQEAKKLEKQKA